MPNKMTRLALACGLAMACTNAMANNADPTGTELAELDAVVASAMDTFSIPGVSIAVVKGGETVLAKGYGVRNIDQGTPVDANTMFGIASNTKAMTAVTLAILVDDGKLNWDDRVTDHIPEFELGDPYVTREFRIRDLLIHQSGLGAGAGDLMVFPQTDFTMDEIIAGLRHLPMAGEFRTEFVYNNLFYAIAGEVVRRVSGQRWAEFLEDRVFRPAGMKNCYGTADRARGRNMAAPHVMAEAGLKTIAMEEIEAVAPAGAVVCDAEGMARWLTVMLAKGKLRSGDRLFSLARYDDLTRPYTPVPVSALPPTEKDIFGINLGAYGFGWFLSDRDGELSVSHTGLILGMVSIVALLPEQGVGIVVMTNQQAGAGRLAIATHLMKAYLDSEQRDWVAYYKDASAKRSSSFEDVEAQVAATIAQAGPSPVPLLAYTGTYRDAWRGDAFIREEEGRLVLEFSRTDQLIGPLEHYRNGVFVVRWRDRTLDADAFVRFTTGFDGDIEGMTMRAVSGRTDFSFDFHDLNFTRLADD